MTMRFCPSSGRGVWGDCAGGAKAIFHDVAVTTSCDSHRDSLLLISDTSMEVVDAGFE